ncbi:hypothetical protein FRUB_02316 [Fimbriiglobus ruber]|uniref:DUF1501 domain-containing protein n=1 Tax=Fimbriiglobus ruber TaxID=1908690 RepID=A0A225DXT2_9BACT|nr:hypothetical protein FRUB_02316 [Fimbriiglobus ruber]
MAMAGPTIREIAPTADACIFLMLTGGPSQLDTWDPKPDAPSDVRGPFRPIQTKIPGVQFSELFPKMAAIADKFSLIRGMHHTAAPVHETGFQLVNTGHLFGAGPAWPAAGAVVNSLVGDSRNPWCVLPDAALSTGITIGHGQTSGFLHGSQSESARQTISRENSHGRRFEAACRDAIARVSGGARFVTVNMFPTVFDSISWDCHADGGSLATDLNDYRDTVAPSFDLAFSSLIADLDEWGQLERTLVVATGEFGRTPKLNANGGRDHWPGCWTALVAGGGTQGGRVVGASDATASAPKDRPVSPQEFVATIFHAFGFPPETTIPSPAGSPVRVVDANPVRELF